MLLMFIDGLFLHSLDYIESLLLNLFHRDSIINLSSISIIMPFSGYSHMIFYYMFGIYLNEYYNFNQLSSSGLFRFFNIDIHKKGIASILFFVGLIGLLIIKYIYTKTFLWEGIYLENGYSWISTLLLTIGAFLLIRQVDENPLVLKFAKLVGTNTMGIYYIHFILLDFSLCYFQDIFGLSFLSNCIKTVIVLLICLCFSSIIKKIPFIKYVVL